MARLCADADVRAVLVFGSRARSEARPDSDLDLAVIVHRPQLTPAEKAACWQRFRQALGPLGVRVDLVVAGVADAERLSGSRWHVFGDVAREGKVLYVAG
ncbi:nucleotidyltransferase family protein [Cyanobium sp. Cruz-8D1]|uniref:nucleotidyltransferase family protein n=1 Tax=Cyanobium sp. Cruz-8D1 TaxID=2823711 RepID=UPI0020CDA784|nr:nucleotidyltransferase domain-containing protein [Cyanobium sp. Cruz-8D1]